MAKTKISKIAKDLNVSVTTVIEFLGKRNITIDANPNTRVEDDIVDMLMSAFKSDKDLKNRSEQITTERRENRVKPAPAQPEEVKIATPQAHAPHTLEYIFYLHRLHDRASPTHTPIPQYIHNLLAVPEYG